MIESYPGSSRHISGTKTAKYSHVCNNVYNYHSRLQKTAIFHNCSKIIVGHLRDQPKLLTDSRSILNLIANILSPLRLLSDNQQVTNNNSLFITINVNIILHTTER